MRIRAGTRLIAVALIIAAAALAMARPAGAEPAHDEFFVCTAPGTQWRPDISGNIVVWSDMRNTSMENSCDIWGYDLASKTEFPICTATAGQWYPAIRDQLVVWQDYRDQTTGADIIGYDLAAGKEFVVEAVPDEQNNPTISSGIVVWEDMRNDPGNGTNVDIYGYNLLTHQEFPVCTAASSQFAPAIDGRWIVWIDYRNDSGDFTNSDIYGFDLLSGREVVIADGDYKETEPAVYGDVVVWADYRNDPGDGSNSDIYGRNMLTGETFPICTAPGNQRRPAIFGDVVVWEDYRNDPGDGSNADIYGADLRTHEEFALCLAEGSQKRPAISGNIVVWEDDRNASTTGADIYGCFISDEHTLAISALSDLPSIASGGSTQLRATPYDSRAHQVTWSWSDGGAGGTFSPSPQAQSPIYTAPGNDSDGPAARNLTVTATCCGSPSLTATADLTVMEEAKPRPIEVMVTAQPTRIRSGGTVALTAEGNDPGGRQITSWEWSDGGAGGAFAPSATVPNVTYAAPAGVDATIALTATVGCDGDPGVAGCGSVAIVAHDFADVPPDSWAANEVYACYSAGIVDGYPDGRYVPSVSVTRDQMAVYISRAIAGGDASVPSGPAQATFADVPLSHWASRYIEYVSANQIAAGYPDGTYQPENVVDRGQMAVFVARAIVTPTGEAGLASFTPPFRVTFPDVTSTGDWAWCHKHIEFIASRAIASGYPDGLYHPEYACARDQMAVYISRAFGLVK
jgi:beta propeller repeat protein